MRKARILLALGTWVAVLPYLGFPYSWKDTLCFITGLVIICFSYVLYKENKSKEEKTEKVFDNFSENKNFEDVVTDVGRLEDMKESRRTTSHHERERSTSEIEEYRHAPPDETI